MTLNTISFFAGGGGLELGFSATGYNIRYSSDIDEYSCLTLKLNSGRRPYYANSTVVRGDIRDMQPEQVLATANLEVGDVDMIIGGPPCQAFSIFGRRQGLDDERGNLVYDYLRMVRGIRPAAFVFENVDGLTTIHDGELYKELKESLSLDGEYEVSAHLYNVATLGIPQNRSRVFFIGARNGASVPEMPVTHGVSDLFKLAPFRTVAEALNDMPPPGLDSPIPNHVGRNHSQRIIDRYAGLAYGERDPKTRINKLDPERPSYTIIVGSDKGGGKGHVHPFEPREVTPRESARIQTFPDWWEFSGKGRHVIRQVGNAVPPLFAALLAEHIKKHVFKIEDNLSYQELIETLELDFLAQTDDNGLLQPQDTLQLVGVAGQAR